MVSNRVEQIAYDSRIFSWLAREEGSPGFFNDRSLGMRPSRKASDGMEVGEAYNTFKSKAR